MKFLQCPRCLTDMVPMNFEGGGIGVVCSKCCASLLPTQRIDPDSPLTQHELDSSPMKPLSVYDYTEETLRHG